MMTLEQINNASDEELNIEIAELCGWTDIHVVGLDSHNFVGSHPSDSMGIHWSKGEHPIPNCIGDANVMHGVEMYLFELPDGVSQQYIRFLTETDRGWESDISKCTFANSRNRAEAFIRTMQYYKNKINEPTKYCKGPANNPYVYG